MEIKSSSVDERPDLAEDGASDRAPAEYGGSDRAAAAVSDVDLGKLRDERDVALSSLKDLEREHDAGDLSDSDYSVLRDRYTARAAAVLRDIAEVESSSSGHPGLPSSAASASADDEGLASSDGHETTQTEGSARSQDTAVAGRSPASRSRTRRRRRRRLLGVTGCGLVLAGVALILVDRLSSDRLPGETASGSVRLSSQQQLQQSLQQAETLEAQGDGAAALKVYQQVLKTHPNEEVALSESGWLEFEAGVEAGKPNLLSSGQSAELRAQSTDRNAYAPHLYLGSMYLVEGQSANAVAQYRLFLSDNPPSQVVTNATTFIDRAFSEAGVPAPALPSG